MRRPLAGISAQPSLEYFRLINRINRRLSPLNGEQDLSLMLARIKILMRRRRF